MANKLDRVIWNKRRETKKPDLKPVGNDWLMDTMPFNAVLKERLTDNKPLQYLCEGKSISFKPVGGTLSRGKLRADKRNVSYKDGLGAGISLEVEVSQAHWRKLIKIDSLSAIDTSQKFIGFKFLVDSDFDIPERENRKPRIKLGENSFIEVSQAWDSSPEVIDEETGETSENRIPVKSFFKKIEGKFYFIKQIPTEWLKTSQFPIWTDVDIVYGSAQEFESGETDYSQCCEIDTNKFVVVYQDIDDDYAGKARVGTVSGTTITWGAINEFCSFVYGSQLGICKLDTDKFVVVYSDKPQGYDGYARVGTVSVRTISWGTHKEFETDNISYPSCCQLGTDKFAIAYEDDTALTGKVCICTVATTTITSGTPVNFEGAIQYAHCCKLHTDKFVAVYTDTGDSNKCKACAFTVVGTTPTAGAIKEIDANSSAHTECAQLDTDKFVIAWEDTDDTAGAIEICTVSGTTIAEGAEVELNPDNVKYIGLAKIDATHFVVIYRDEGNVNKGTSRYCSFSGTTITLDGEELFHDAVTDWCDVCSISANKIAVVYQDDADVNDIGEAIIGDTPIPGWTGKISGVSSPAKVMGVATANIAKVKGVA